MSWFCPWCMAKKEAGGRCSTCGCELHVSVVVNTRTKERVKGKRASMKSGPTRFNKTLFGKAECVWCGTAENLTVHHFHPIGKGGTDAKDNRIPLCETHHRIIHSARNIQRGLWLDEHERKMRSSEYVIP